MLTVMDPIRDDWKQGKFRERLPSSRVIYLMLLLPCLAEFLIVDYPVLIHISLCTNILVYSRVRWFTSTLMLFTMLHSIKAGLDIRANRSFFAQKWVNERFAQKNERFTHLLIFGERNERFTHDRSFPLSALSKLLMVTHFWWATWGLRSHRSFLVSDLSGSLPSLTRKEEMSDSLIF